MSLVPEYVLARRVLLDALDALGAQRDAVVLVGAQAIYLHTGDGDLAVPVMTTDADLAVDPRRLHDEPQLVVALTDAGFTNTGPGSWTGHAGVALDLMVPATLAGRPGKRGADLGQHGARVARGAGGLEAALIDRTVQRISSLDPSEERALDVAVAGPAALLIAKLHKIGERLGTHRAQDKDALDVLRLLRVAEAPTLAASLHALLRSPDASAVTAAALEQLQQHFRHANEEGPRMAARACFPAESPEEIAASTAVLATELLAAMNR